jgi:hypothetical protein
MKKLNKKQKLKLKSLPKAEFHNHLILGVSRKAFRDYYPQSKITFPRFYNGLPGMREFIHTYINPLMQPKDIECLLELNIENCIKENIVYLEASIDLNLRKYLNFDIGEVINIAGRL